MLTAEGFQTQTTQTQPRHTQLVPHSIEAEQALLGSLVIDPSQMIETSYLKKGDFYMIYHGYLYDAMVELFERHGNYDIVTLTSHLESAGHMEDVGGVSALMDMINTTPTSYGAPEYAEIIYRHSVSRQVVERAMVATQSAYQNVTSRSGDELVNEVIGSFSEIDASRNVSGGPQHMANGANLLLARREQIMMNGSAPGVPTGIKTLDQTLGGLDSDKFYVLAGRPGMGKSALALQMAYNMAAVGVGVLIFSLEMSGVDIAARLTSIELCHMGCKLPYKDIMGGIGDDSQIIQAVDNIARLPITIDSTPALTVSQIRHRAQKESLKSPVDIVIVDHGGLVTPAKPTGNAYNDMNQNATDLMALPKQLELPVITLLQLSRSCENRNDKRPMLSDLRDSGKWEENADSVMLIYRDQYYNPDTEYPMLGEVNIAKNRDGQTGKVELYADVANNRFVDLETREVQL